MIIKIQRPLNSPELPVLVYNKDRSFMRMVVTDPLRAELMKYFSASDLKVYAEVEVDGDQITLKKKLEPQPW